MIKISETIKNIFKNNTVQSISLLVIGCYLLSSFIIAFLFRGGTASNGLIFHWLIYFPLILLLNFIIFSPAYIAVYLVFKKTNKTYLRVLSVSFFIPFLNLIYFYIEMHMSVSSIYYSCMIGALWLFLILPSVFFITLFIPKKILQIKKLVLLTTFFTMVFGWLLIGSIIPISIIQRKLFPKQRTQFWNPIIIHQLEDYRPIINHIKLYQVQKGKFPKNISSFKIYSKSYPYYSYETFNNEKDFVLSVSKYEFKKHCIFCYRYCSNRELPGCKAIGFSKGSTYWQLGNWVYEYLDD